MTRASRRLGGEDVRLTLGVLSAAGDDKNMSQRGLALELGVALGIVNAYVKRCVRKGLLKVSQAPARRYAYYLTPEGFTEKSRLTAEYLTHSFSFFRKTRSDCSALLSQAKTAGWRRLAIAGVSDVTEVAALCAMEAELEIVCIVDTGGVPRRFVGRPVVTSYDGLVLQWNIDDGTTKGFGGKGKVGRAPPMPVSADSRHSLMAAHRRCSRPPSPCARRNRKR